MISLVSDAYRIAKTKPIHDDLKIHDELKIDGVMSHKHGCNNVILRVSQRSWHVEQVDTSITMDDAAIGGHGVTMQFLTRLCVKKWSGPVLN